MLISQPLKLICEESLKYFKIYVKKASVSINENHINTIIKKKLKLIIILINLTSVVIGSWFETTIYKKGFF